MYSSNSSYDDDDTEEDIVADEHDHDSQDISDQNTSTNEIDEFEYKRTENVKTANELNINENKFTNEENDFTDEKVFLKWALEKRKKEYEDIKRRFV